MATCYVDKKGYVHITELSNHIAMSLALKLNCCNIMAVSNPENKNCGYKLSKLGFASNILLEISEN